MARHLSIALCLVALLAFLAGCGEIERPTNCLSEVSIDRGQGRCIDSSDGDDDDDQAQDGDQDSGDGGENQGGSDGGDDNQDPGDDSNNDGPGDYEEAAATEIAGVIAAMNAIRAEPQNCGQHGDFAAVPPITGNSQLHEASLRHAIDMAENGFFSHTGSDGSSFSQRISESGYPGSPVAENIAGGGREAAGVVDRWLNSDGHCRNLMTNRGTEIGVGFVEGGQWGTLWVLKVGRQ